MEIFGVLVQYKKGALSYTDKVALFFRIYPEKERSLKVVFEVEDEFSLPRLHAGLDAKLSELQANISSNDFRTFRETEPRKINVELLPSDLRQKFSIENGKRHRKIQFLHARLRDAKDDKARRVLAAEIVQLTSERRAVFKQVDEFLSTGKYAIAEEPEKVQEQKSVDANALKNYQKEYDLRLLRSRRSKAKKDPAKQDLFKELDAQIKELEKTRYL